MGSKGLERMYSQAAQTWALCRVTIADYKKIKVTNPIASGANGVTDLEQYVALNNVVTRVILQNV